MHPKGGHDASQYGSAHAQRAGRGPQGGLSTILWEADTSLRHFSLVSVEAEELLGYPLERWRSEPNFWLRLVHPDDRDRVNDSLREASSSGRDLELEYRVVTASGRVLWLRHVQRAVRDERGHIRLLRGAMVDLTEFRRVEEALRESQRFLSTAMSHLPGMAFRARLSSQWTTEFVSEGCFALTGYYPSTFVGPRRQSFVEVIHPEDRARVAQEARSILETERTYELYYRIVTADGEVKWVWERGRGVYSGTGELLAIEGFITDVTERKRSEEERERLLAREQAALAEAQAALRTRDEFLSNAAHELRTPIMAVQGYAELLETEAQKRSDPDEMRALAAIARQSKRLQRLVQELVEVSRLQLERLELYRRRLNLADLIAGVSQEMQDVSRRHRLTLCLEDTVMVDADGYRIEQVLMNLLTNAIKYSPDGGSVELTLVAAGDEAIVSVRDQGIGIPKSGQSKLFERFFRAHAGTPNDFKGMGLGLYLSRQFIERHGGKMWFESEEGKGSTFYFSLPLAERN